MTHEITIEKRDNMSVKPESRSGNSFAIRLEDVIIYVDRQTLIELGEMIDDQIKLRRAV